MAWTSSSFQANALSWRAPCSAQLQGRQSKLFSHLIRIFVQSQWHKYSTSLWLKVVYIIYQLRHGWKPHGIVMGLSVFECVWVLYVYTCVSMLFGPARHQKETHKKTGLFVSSCPSYVWQNVPITVKKRNVFRREKNEKPHTLTKMDKT